jgi:alpha-mannosidase
MLPKSGTEIQVHVRVFWLEKSRFLKLAIPMKRGFNKVAGQVAYGIQKFSSTGEECAAQKWISVLSGSKGKAVSCINDGVYGFHFKKECLYLSLLRSPVYSGLPIFERPITPNDRFVPRIDQGERQFSFWFNAGDEKERMQSIDREALSLNEKPFPLSFFPPGIGDKPATGLSLSDSTVQMTAFKLAEDSNDFLILRLQETTGKPRQTTFRISAVGISKRISLGRFEVKTLRIQVSTGSVEETNLIEESIQDINN